MEPAFYTDREVAKRLNLSPEWVRVQRHKRSKGQDHTLDLEPRQFGRAVRYDAAEVEAFIAAIGAKAGSKE